MTSMDMDMDINNYSFQELLDIFHLPEQFDHNIVDINISKMKAKLLNNYSITYDVKNNIIQFVDNAKTILLQHLDNNNFSHFDNNEYFFNEVNTNTNSNNIFSNKVNEKQKEDANKKENNDITVVNHLNVDTRFRDNLSQSSTNFDVELPLALNNVTKIKLNCIELPTSFYMISKSLDNYHFSVTFTTRNANANENTYNAIFQLPEGNYTSTSFLNALNNVANYHFDFEYSDFLVYEDTSDPNYYNQFAPEDSSNFTAENYKNIFHYIHFDIDVDNEGSGTGKIIAKVLNNPYTLQHNNDYAITSLNLTFNKDVLGNASNTQLFKKFGWICGFRNDAYTLIFDDANTISNSQIISEGLLNITGPKYIYLIIDDLNVTQNFASHFISAFNALKLVNNVLARIPISSSSFGFEISNYLNIVSTPREYNNPITIKKIKVKFIDEFGRILDLNNMNVSFSLAFTSSYQSHKSEE